MKTSIIFLLGFLIHGTEAWWGFTTEEEKCMDELGCFRRDGDFFHAIYRPISVFPEARLEVNTTFELFTRANQMEGKELVAGNRQLLQDSGFSASKLTKIIIHGLTGTGNEPWIESIKDTLLVYGDFNVIVCDWRDGATMPYHQAVASTRVSGAEIGLLIKYLIDKASASASDFHIIGFSLGGHVAGYAGERVTDLGRISGLEPASPFFENMPSSICLDPSDALFVDVIHTDSESTVLGVITGDGGLGMAQPCGHIDFYPNGGKNQPGCEDTSFGERTIKELDELIEHVACDHLQVVEIFSASISDCTRFKAIPCASWEDYKNGQCSDCGSSGCGIMGFHADQAKPAAGVTGTKHYLETLEPPQICAENSAVNVITLILNFGSPTSWSENGQVTVKLSSSTGPRAELQLSTEFIPLQSGRSLIATGTFRSSITHITQAQITWERSSRWWNLFSWRSSGSYIYIDTISLSSNQEAGRLTLFCGGNQALEAGVAMKLDATDSCSYLYHHHHHHHHHRHHHHRVSSP